MKCQLKIQACCALILTTLSLIGWAGKITEPTIVDEFIVQNGKVIVPDTCVSLINKKFNFDWSNYKTIPDSISSITEVEKLLSQTKNYAKLNKTDKESLGILLNKLGGYYAFVTPQTDLAISKLNQALPFLSKKNDIAWNNILLAYAFMDKYRASEQVSDKDKALYYINKVITLYPQQKYPQVAFAYYVKGDLQNFDNETLEAEFSYKKALDIYAQIKDIDNNQYYMTKQALDNNLLGQKNHENLLSDLLKGVGDYQMIVKPFREKNDPTAINFIKNPLISHNTICKNQ